MKIVHEHTPLLGLHPASPYIYVGVNLHFPRGKYTFTKEGSYLYDEEDALDLVEELTDEEVAMSLLGNQSA